MNTDKKHQKRLGEELIRKNLKEHESKLRLLKVFTPETRRSIATETAPPENSKAMTIMNDINQLEQQHTDFIRSLGSKHT